jgi:FlaA1/EpsC-like NDP-sugar epimerase
MQDSPQEAIRTNILGTYHIALLAQKHKAKKMVLVSTDKAVRSTNVMGATKYYAETIMRYFAKQKGQTAYAAVRFGNVLASNGSVIPLFKKQIEQGGPVTVTDKEITRFFMTIPEAVGLILQCGVLAKDGEIFILDMGQPVKIIDLAEKMIRQSGYIPYEEIRIEFTGLRPGEKMYEELLLDPKTTVKTQSEKIFIDRIDLIEFNELRFKELISFAESNHQGTTELLFKQLNLKG